MKPLSKKRLFATHLITILILAALVMVVIVEQWLLVDLPNPNELYNYTTAPSTKIYDRHGRLLYEITDPHQGQHTPLTLDEIPPACIMATIATEDASFYSNPGVDAWAIIRALYINVAGGEVLSGGSTITQQLARNLLLSPQERHEVSLTRKLREAILAWRLARTYSKDEILTLYLNETYYGNLAYGIEAASRTYFGKHVAELDLAECAMLAGLPQSPAGYNPLENPATARARQNVVLDLLAKHAFLPTDEVENARREELGFAAIPFPIEAPHFVMHVRGELERTYGLEAIYRQGLEVHTTLNLDMQKATERITRYRLKELTQYREGEPPRNVRNAAVVVLDPHTGEILVMLGSPNYFDPEIDGAVNATVATRQPGSSIKPITYAAAFDPQLAAQAGYEPLTAASMMVDDRTAFVTKEGEPYVPENYDRVWRGPVLLRQSLASSYNLIAVKVLDYVGLETMIDLSRALGITTFDNKEFGLALTLGGGEVRLLELTGAYSAFANGGRRIEPVAITRITDHNGTLIYQWQTSNNPGPRVLDPRTAYLITDILSDNYARRSTFGANSPLRLTRPAAAKTGTSQDWRDNWAVGYTPDLVAGVWAGNADNEPMRHISGVTGAAPIWRDIMEELHKARPVRNFIMPEGLVKMTVCADNGLLPAVAEPTAPVGPTLEATSRPAPCPHTITEIFIPGTEPQRIDNWTQAVALDRRNGLLAGPDCPLEFVRFQTFTLYPAEAQAWASKQGVPQPPAAYSDLCPAPSDRSNEAIATEPRREPPSAPLLFTSPDQGSTFRLAPHIPADKQKIRVSVRPANGVTMRQVLLLVDGELLADGPEMMWQMRPGTHTFSAVGTDTAGNEITADEVTVTVLEYTTTQAIR
jgi:1A family penicillin-binding protein